MIVQIIPVTIAEGTREAFERTWHDERHVYEKAPQCRRAAMLRCVETANSYKLYVEWDALAAHEAFQKTPERDRFLAALHPFLAIHGEITHYEIL